MPAGDFIDLLTLQNLTKAAVGAAFPERIWVRAEIAGLREGSGGHCYLELSQSARGRLVAQARAVIWRSRYPSVSQYFEAVTGARLGAGIEVLARVQVSFHELYGLSLDEIEYSAEVALEHHLGLTCDPVCGLVQIPCIERNAVGAMRAINAVSLANFLAEGRKISFDTVVRAMYETGRDISERYRETSTGGLAKLYK